LRISFSFFQLKLICKLYLSQRTVTTSDEQRVRVNTISDKTRKSSRDELLIITRRLAVIFLGIDYPGNANCTDCIKDRVVAAANRFLSFLIRPATDLHSACCKIAIDYSLNTAAYSYRP